MRWTNSTYRLAMRGFSLVEIMVAMVIGLIAVIVIFQVFAVFERQKRTSTGAGLRHRLNIRLSVPSDRNRAAPVTMNLP